MDIQFRLSHGTKQKTGQLKTVYSHCDASAVGMATLG